MTEPAIHMDRVVRRFGKKEVLHDLTLSVPQGKTYAFLGRNGAGKTTTIRMLLGLLTPSSGHMRVLGLDPAKDALNIRRQVGYLAEDQQMWGWMRVSELLWFMAPFYPTWDRDLARTFLKQFDLPEKEKIAHLSKGQSVRLGLLLALAHRPGLVILDDPALGLDPIMRKQFNRDIVDHLQGRGATVFFSSHLLYEIEPVADAVAILDAGRIVRHASTDELRDDVKLLLLPPEIFHEHRQRLAILDVRTRGRQTAVVVERAPSALALLQSQGVSPQVVDLNLDEIFEAYVIGNKNGSSDAQTVLERMP